MDRISALRNIEDALTEYEHGEIALPELEAEVRGILRTYATEFDGKLTAYRAVGDGRAAGLVVVAASKAEARDRIEGLLSDTTGFDVEPVD